MRYKVLDYLTRPRLNFLDACWMSAFTTMMLMGHYFRAFLVVIFGAFITVMLEKISRNSLLHKYAEAQKKRERIWQDMTDRGLKIEAIKAYREIHNSTLADAKNAVEEYIGQRKN